MDSQSKTDFLLWEAASRSFWRSLDKDDRSDKDGSRRWIYVDLMHDNPDYLLRSLTTARYLAHITGFPLVGLVGEPGVVPGSCTTPLDAAWTRQLAAAFGIEQIEPVPDPADDMAGFLQCLHGAVAKDGKAVGLGELRGERLRTLLPQVRHDGLPVGAYAYETFLRSERQPALESLAAPLLKAGRDCLALDHWIRTMFAERPPAWFVTGHVDYNPWGVIGWRMLEADAQICWFSVHGLMGARILSGPPPAEGTLSRLAREGTATLFETAIWPHNRRLRDAVVAFHQRRRSGGFHRTWNALRVRELTLPPASRAHAAALLRARLGLPPDRPTVGILCHAMTDTPRADRQIHTDYADWLTRTLAFAATHRDRSWLVKPHPHNAGYDITGFYGRLKELYADAPHIRFGGLPNEAWPLVCDVVTTVRGTPGFEFASLGVPVVVAGRSLYSDHGFCRVADSEDAYHTLLTAPVATLALTAEEVERAQIHIYAEAFAFCVASPLLPPFCERLSEPDYWRERAISLNWAEITADPWYQALEDAVRRALPRTLAPPFRGGLLDDGADNDTGDGAVAATGTDAALAPERRRTVEPGEKLLINTGGTGLDHTVSGSLATEDGWAWMNGEPLLFVLPLSKPVDAGLELTIEAMAFVAPENPRVELDIRFGGVPADQIVFETNTLHVRRVPIPPGCVTEDGAVVVELHGSPARVPGEIIGNGDSRNISVALFSLTLDIAAPDTSTHPASGG